MWPALFDLLLNQLCSTNVLHEGFVPALGKGQPMGRPCKAAPAWPAEQLADLVVVHLQWKVLG